MTLQVTEFTAIAQFNGNAIPVLQAPVLNATTSLAAAGTYTVKTAGNCAYVELTADAAAHVVHFGTVGNTYKLLSGQSKILSLPKGTTITVVS